MSRTEELEEEVYRLRHKRNDLEDKMRQIMRIQEEEDYDMQFACRKLEQAWNDYGKDDPELERLLEEEKAVIDKYKIKFAEYDEQIRNEFHQEMDDIDREEDTLRMQIRDMEDTKEEGDTEDGSRR